MSEPEENESELLGGQPRWVRGVLIASGMPVLLCFVGLFLFQAISASDEAGWVALRSRTPVPLELVRPVLIGVGILFLATLAVLFMRRLHVAWSARDPAASSSDAGLKLGERVIWAARPGWRTLTGSRALVLSLTVLGPVLIGWWLWRILTGVDVWPRAFWALLLIGLLFGSIVPAIVLGRHGLRRWVFDLAGTVAVTDRRVVWRSPMRGVVYREIAGDSIIGAVLVDQRGRRGWVAVTEQMDPGVKEHDLFGLSDPERAVAAIEGLSRTRERGACFPTAVCDPGG